MALNGMRALEDQPALQRHTIMTNKPSFSLAAFRRICLPAVACAVLVGGTLPALAQFGTTACTFRNSDISNSLRQSVASQLGINRNQVEIPIIMVPTFNDNLGQPGSLAGITLCSNTDAVASVSPTTESAQFPSSGAAVIQEIQQTSYVLVNGNRMRICQSDQQTGCVVITKK